MPRTPFRFQLQPALDKAEAEQRRCEDELAGLRRDLAAQHERLEALVEKLAGTVQQLRAAHDNLAGANSAQELARRCGYIETLRHREQREQAEVRRQQDHISFLEVTLEEKRQELSEKMAAVKVLEKLRDKAKAEHDTAQRKREEVERDDQAVQNWNRKRRSGADG